MINTGCASDFFAVIGLFLMILHIVSTTSYQGVKGFSTRTPLGLKLSMALTTFAWHKVIYFLFPIPTAKSNISAGKILTLFSRNGEIQVNRKTNS